MQKEVKVKGYAFTVGHDKAMEYSLEQVCGYTHPPQEVLVMALFE